MKYSFLSWYLPDGHWAQKVFLSALLYVPFRQDMHDPPVELWYVPAAQSVQLDDPVGAMDPAGQRSQISWLYVVVILPARQSSHSLSLPNLPGKHAGVGLVVGAAVGYPVGEAVGIAVHSAEAPSPEVHVPTGHSVHSFVL